MNLKRVLTILLGRNDISVKRKRDKQNSQGGKTKTTEGREVVVRGREEEEDIKEVVN
jgi:hypothetical protein